MKKLKIKLLRMFHQPSAAKVRSELRKDYRRNLLANMFYQAEHRHG